eukprot:Gregarina_sp_Pseudo_9__5510@NODE_715_length_2321_cov_10_832165_g673_i0_p1_GENE_NODE_715_length_2321_cov_10_832165_g673_i0NODE_715_length_2321_cov_10_832165_g673_i0_p1_ORF_typecomplete_len728_score90_72SAS6_N/PF16531_5/1_5e14SAS6_N/PF16531_5/1_2e03HOOK/PF05622_12/0_001KASH_CCD/PF14662_6/3_9e03KASH_CCD/PF14662_6/0_0012EzrA/PF06160_12/3_4e02EzrA/PF06160_12/0_0013MAD/PF05557_13/5_3MAD/PF05557_13/0_003TMF_TATA_bd/PF12325_8/1_1e03TMF_TATA_bd/PF12325_8/13TMF_TATA_bd/PF12325_8/0_018HSP70/PF00012_20/0_02
MHVNPNPYYYHQYYPPGSHPPPQAFAHLSDSVAVGGVPVARGESPRLPVNGILSDQNNRIKSASPSPLTTTTSKNVCTRDAETLSQCTECFSKALPNLNAGSECLIRPDSFRFVATSENATVTRRTWLHDFRNLISIQKFKEKPKYQKVLNVNVDQFGLIEFSLLLLTSSQSLIQDKSHGPIMSLLLYACCNPQVCYLFECNEGNFSTLKEEQNLKISFSQFPDKMTEILQQIPAQYEIKITNPSRLAGDLESSSSSHHQTNSTIPTAVLSIFESNEFRIYNHLSLKVQRLKCCDVKKILSHELLVFQNFADCLSWRLDQEMCLCMKQQSRLQELEQEKNDLVAQHASDLCAVVDENSARLDNAKETFAIKFAEVEAGKAALKEQLLLAEREGEALKLEIHRLSLVEAEHRGCASVLQDKKDLSTKLAVANAKLVDKDETIDALKAQLKDYDAMKTKYDIMEGEASSAKSVKEKLEEKSEQLNAYKERTRTLQTKLKEAEDTVCDLETKFEEARKEIEELKTEFSDRNQAYNVNIHMLEKKDLRIQQLEAEFEKICQANFELNRRLTDSIVRNAKRQQPEHFKSDTTSIDRILFPEKSEADPAANTMAPPLHARTASHPNGLLPSRHSQTSSTAGNVSQPAGSHSSVPIPATQPLPSTYPHYQSATGGAISTPKESHKFPALPHSATLHANNAPPFSSDLNFSFSGQKKAKNAFNIRRNSSSQRGSL